MLAFVNKLVVCRLHISPQRRSEVYIIVNRLDHVLDSALRENVHIVSTDKVRRIACHYQLCQVIELGIPCGLYIVDLAVILCLEQCQVNAYLLISGSSRVDVVEREPVYLIIGKFSYIGHIISESVNYILLAFFQLFFRHALD